MENLPASQPQIRSSFVTVLAWIFIVIMGLATFVSVLQNLMITFLFPGDGMPRNMHFANGQDNMPAFFQFMFNHMRLFVAGFLVLAATMFVSAIGLLKRKNWARIVFVVYLGFCIVASIGGVFLQNAFIAAVVQMPHGVPLKSLEYFDSIVKVLLIVSGLISIAFSMLAAWLIKRLVSKSIRAEFQPAGH